VSERLVLTVLAVDDADEMVAVLGDAALYEFIGGGPLSLAALRDRYRHFLAGPEIPGEIWLNWVVRTECDRAAVGTVQATVSSVRGRRAAELAWVTGVRWQGRGFATEAVRALVEWLHAHGVDDLSAHISPRHHASAAVARRAGLQPTGEAHDVEVLWRTPVAAKPPPTDGRAAGTPVRKGLPLSRTGHLRRGATATAIALTAALLAGCGSPASVPGTSSTQTSTTTSTTSTSTSTTSTSTPTTTPTTATSTSTTSTTTTTSPATTTSSTITTLPATSTTTACSSANDLSTWSVQRLAAQTVVIPVDEGAVVSIRSEIAAGAGGLILFGSSAPTDLGERLQSLEASAPGGIVPLVMADEEGGVVQRLANLVGSLPSARQMGATMTPAQIRRLATGIAVRMRAEGVTMDLAPVLDVDGGQGPNNQDPDGTRSFSTDPKIASADGIAFAEGLEAGGVVPVVKHFPGLGGATGNTDVMSASTPPWSTLQKVGLVPFQDALAARLPAVMIANASVPGLSSLPASISPEVITKLLRDQLGYDGLVVTDSLSAVSLTAIGYSVPAATVAALEAGADMVLFNADASAVAGVTNQIVSAVASAVASGRLPRSRLENAVAHILSVKHVEVCRPA
jgi:beta-N-acetylhexosaminidase